MQVWEPSVTVARYSPDQARWARARLARAPYGGDLARLFPGGPEDGTARADGNALTEAGRENLARLAAGDPAALPLAPTGHAAVCALFGVGADPAANPDPVSLGALAPALGEAPHVTWYQEHDPGYPRAAGPGMVEGQVTVAEEDACFEWNEWGWAAVPRRDVAAVRSWSLAQAAEGAVLLNRKAAFFGPKETGSAWVLRVSIAVAI